MQKENRLSQLLKELEALPKGNISIKNIRGKDRMYLQWSEGGKVKNKYVKAGEQATTIALLERRRALEQEYQELLMGVNSRVAETVPSFYTNVTIGSRLEYACKAVAQLQERSCISTIYKYLKADLIGRVCLVYGLRRTGKTTMLLQAMGKLPLEKTAYIKLMPSDTMEALNRDLKTLADLGYRYVFIDEVTLLQDFIESASLFSDVYAMFGMKLVMSGTDSLGFAIAVEEELYDRTITVHTTFIPFREYSRLLGIHDIDEYIRYGGTLRAGDTSFNAAALLEEGVSFADKESTRKYIDTAIAKNIQHSLACYNAGSHFCHLVDLYEHGELTNAINRIVEDMNYRFLLSVINNDFKSHDLGSIAQLERKDAMKANRFSILDRIDKQMVTRQLMHLLDIRNQDQLAIKITPDHLVEIKSYLKILELIVDFPTERMGAYSPSEQVLFAQPGMRYCQAQALVYALLQEPEFKKYDATERNAICDRLLEEVRGRLLEEIVLLETLKALPKQQRAFKLYFDIGEFDMVVCDTQNITCKIYEIKHTDKCTPQQYKNLLNEEKCALTQFQYGTITEKIVLYQGKNKIVDGIRYQNLKEYLETL